jgi:hypothetical protein
VLAQVVERVPDHLVPPVPVHVIQGEAQHSLVDGFVRHLGIARADVKAVRWWIGRGKGVEGGMCEREEE